MLWYVLMRNTSNSPEYAEAIDVEVLEIDGVAPTPVRDSKQNSGHNRTKSLEIRSPLMMIAAVIGTIFLAIGAVFIGALYLVFKLIRLFFQAVFS